MRVSHKTPEFIQLNPIGQAPLLDTLVSHLICSFFREELKFPNHLIVQLLGSHLARVESAKRISKYDMLMKLVAVFEELVMIWCDNLQVTWFCSFSLDLIVHDIVIGVYVLYGWANHNRRFFNVLIAYDIVAAVAWALIAIDFTAHTCGNDSWTLSMIESELSLFSTEAKLVLPCMLALDLAWHSLEFGTRFNEESSAIMPPVGNSKSSLFPSDEFDFFLIIIEPITLGFFNVEIRPITCWIKCLRFQSADLDARVKYEFWANSDVECCSKCENQWAFFTHFKGAAQAIEQNHLPPYSIIWYFPKYASVFACQDTFWCSIREFPILLELIFVGDGNTQYCNTSGALCYRLNLRVYWKGPKDDMIYSTCIGDNKKGVIVTLWRWGMHA
ncbi:hypothetical protein MTR67_019916 [Solanum verrucosum]|uniref:Vacuolar sorting receptor thioredoxin-like domain-containing protein n=1 Tax=Solanum verrucosum TaxID=315347 RepID=A0AAF0QTT6_SOLVR|nr:hypothetical protein MTR67_019916 [Solanum verrucosum]